MVMARLRETLNQKGKPGGAQLAARRTWVRSPGFLPKVGIEAAAVDVSQTDTRCQKKEQLYAL